MNDQSIIHIALTYLAVINVVTFFVNGIDKWKAKKSKWRVSEATLLGLAVIGGSIGAWLGMKTWHHKTSHRKFRYGVPLILAVQIALFFLCSCGTASPSSLSSSQTAQKKYCTKVTRRNMETDSSRVFGRTNKPRVTAWLGN